MDISNTEPIASLSNTNFKDDYLALCSSLENKAKNAAISLGFDWSASMEEASDNHNPARQALTILKFGLFDEEGGCRS